MDCINIVDLEVFANHGVFPEENVLGQKFIICATLYADLRAAGASDALEDSVHYGEVCHLINNHMKQHTYKLIERVAQSLTDVIFAEYPAINRIELEVKKPWAPIGLPVAYASVKIDRTRA